MFSLKFKNRWTYVFFVKYSFKIDDKGNTRNKSLKLLYLKSGQPNFKK